MHGGWPRSGWQGAAQSPDLTGRQARQAGQANQHEAREASILAYHHPGGSSSPRATPPRKHRKNSDMPWGGVPVEGVRVPKLHSWRTPMMPPSSATRTSPGRHCLPRQMAKNHFKVFCTFYADHLDGHLKASVTAPAVQAHGRALQEPPKTPASVAIALFSDLLRGSKNREKVKSVSFDHHREVLTCVKAHSRPAGLCGHSMGTSHTDFCPSTCSTS